MLKHSRNRSSPFDRRGPDGARAGRQSHLERVEGRRDLAEGRKETEKRRIKKSES